MRKKLGIIFLFFISIVPYTTAPMCPPNEVELGNCTQKERLLFEQYWQTEQQSRREKESESFMFTRPIYRNIAVQQSLWHDAIFGKKCALGGGFQIIGMYQKSINNDSVDRYFLFNHSTTLSVKGDATQPLPPIDRDIRAEWLGLPSDFVGTFSINPRQRQAAVWLEYKQDLYPLLCNDYLKPFWVSIASPVHFVENDINLTQGAISNPNPNPPLQPQDIIQALNQPAWMYGKFGGQQKKVALAELFIKFGIRFLNRNNFQIGMYSFFNFALHHAQRADYIFSPFIGHNHHSGWGTGLTFQLPLNSSCDDFMIALVFNIENIRFFSNKQYRSIDLIAKPWSRYLLLNSKDGQINIPGINILTQEVSVNPFNMVDLEGAFRLQTSNIEAEVGYCLWAHGDENIKLEHVWQEQWGIAGNGALVPGTTIGATASKSTICNLACNDLAVNPVTCQPIVPINPVTCDSTAGLPIATFVPIKKQDLDLLSASARAALVNRVHAAFGMFTTKKAPMAGFFGIGGYVEIPKNNTALSTWGVWGKVGGRF